MRLRLNVIGASRLPCWGSRGKFGIRTGLLVAAGCKLCRRRDLRRLDCDLSFAAQHRNIFALTLSMTMPSHAPHRLPANQRIVITGVGLTAPNGNNLAE